MLKFVRNQETQIEILRCHFMPYQSGKNQKIGHYHIAIRQQIHKNAKNADRDKLIKLFWGVTGRQIECAYVS